MKGEKSTLRNKKGVPLFSDSQVKKNDPSFLFLRGEEWNDFDVYALYDGMEY